MNEICKIIEMLMAYEKTKKKIFLRISFNIFYPYTMLKEINGELAENEWTFSLFVQMIHPSSDVIHSKFFVCACSIYFDKSWYEPDEQEILWYCNMQDLDKLYNSILMKINII